MQGLSTQRAPSAGVVLPHYLFGALAFLVLSVLIILSAEAFTGPYFQPRILAITHVAALGWGSMIIFGALYQLLPVILETPLYSELLAKITFWIFAAGIICLVISFWNFYVGLHIQVAACLVLTAFLLFTFNILMTTRSATNWSVAADFISTAAVWLLATGIIGALMAFNFQYPFLSKSHLLFMKIHAHMGIAGWFILLIMGVASKLIPMFLVSHNLDTKKLSLAYYLVNIGLIAFAADMYFNEGSWLLPLCALVVVAGILVFVSFIYEAFKKRLRKELDIGLKHSFVAFILVVIPAFLAMLISFTSNLPEKIYLVYGISIFLGFITALILGQTFKTLPFIVWLHKYKSLIGKEKTPMPKDLFSEKLARWQLLTYLLSLLALLAGVLTGITLLINAGSILLLVTALLYNLNVFRIVIVKPTTPTT